MSVKSNNYCLNCDERYNEGAKFCSICGQSKRASDLSVKELWTNFWTTIINVDNSFFTTLRLIARPDKLTRLYVSGRRKAHINPIRLFLILLVFLAAATISSFEDFGETDFLSNLNRDYYNSQALERFEETVDMEEWDEVEYGRIQDLKERVFEGVRCIDEDTIFNGIVVFDTGSFKHISKRDFIELNDEEIYKKYQADDFWDRLLYRQYLKMNRDPVASAKYILSNAIWGLIPAILVLSFFLKLLYRHHRISFLEHLIFVTNTHAFFFLFWICAFLFVKFLVEDKSELAWLIPIGYLSNVVYVFIMMLSYYREGFFRSLFKFIMALFVYVFFSFFFIVISVVVSSFVF